MHSVTFVLLSLLSLVLGSEAVCHGVFCVDHKIDQETCNVCATLYFYDTNNDIIAHIQGQGKKIKHLGKSGIRNIHRVRQVSCHNYFLLLLLLKHDSTAHIPITDWRRLLQALQWCKA